MSDALVIIPTYNEKENVEKMLKLVLSFDEKFHILIVDDGSPDGTADIVKKLQENNKEALHLEERKGKLGLGTAYIHGFEWALKRDYQYIFEMDCDFSHDPEDLKRLYKECKDNGADLAIGSRYINGVNVVNWPMGRVLMSYFASVYVRMITGMDVRDATAGFKCYRRSVLEAMKFEKIKFKGYAFQIEMKFRAWRKGFNIVEVPIIFRDRTEGNSKMSGGIFTEAFFGVIRLKIASLLTSRKNF